MAYILALNGALAGIFGTLLMDIASVAGGKLGVVVKPSTRFIGRWIAHFFNGQFIHNDIRCSDLKPYEGQLGVIAHYLIGAALGVIFITFIPFVPFSPKNLAVGLIYGLLTCVFAWFLMMPSFGFGWFGLKGPKEAKMLRTSIYNHLFFGLGIAIWFNILAFIKI